MSDLFLRACRGEAVERSPIWIMRQAGRYLAEYRELRAKHDFLTMCTTPELAATVTLQPMKAFPIVRDLVCDVSWNFRVKEKIKPFNPRKPDHADGTWSMQQEDIERVQEFRKCIECFLCQDVCHVLREHDKHDDFIGPRYFVYSAAMEMHPLDTADRLDELFRGGVYAQVNHLEIGPFQHNIDQILADIVNITLDRPHDKGRDGLEATLDNQRLQNVHSSLHCPGRNEHFWDEILTYFKQAAHFL